MLTSHGVKSLAEELGFGACGIVRIDRQKPGLPFDEDREALDRWVAQGRHGTMQYLEDFESRAKRFWEDFPEAKSVIVLGVNYYSGTDSPSPLWGEGGGEGQNAANHPHPNPLPQGGRGEGPRGRVARYAWGRDYHRVIGKRLEEFRDRLNSSAGRGIRAEICVDTKPLLERPLAQRAGLGFIGKQSQLLSPQFGPWLFLAELVTDLELEPDLPYLGSCGQCTICIDECPTQAIRPEGGIDARRCIAYLTIEHKGEIAEEFKPLMGDRVFGCDICLQVCPYASKGKETHWTELKAESGFGPELDLVKLLNVSSNRIYEKRFEGTALMRANRRQMVRNARIVLRNLESHENRAGHTQRRG